MIYAFPRLYPGPYQALYHLCGWDSSVPANSWRIPGRSEVDFSPSGDARSDPIKVGSEYASCRWKGLADPVSRGLLWRPDKLGDGWAVASMCTLRNWGPRFGVYDDFQNLDARFAHKQVVLIVYYEQALWLEELEIWNGGSQKRNLSDWMPGVDIVSMSPSYSVSYHSVSRQTSHQSKHSCWGGLHLQMTWRLRYVPRYHSVWPLGLSCWHSVWCIYT